jgi:hypothetical protein
MSLIGLLKVLQDHSFKLLSNWASARLELDLHWKFNFLLAAGKQINPF